MLLTFMVENWRSYKEKVVFSMQASRERQGSEHLATLPAMYRGARVLPLAAIYGANASGKSCFFDALAMLRSLVTMGTQIGQLLPAEGYALDPQAHQQPTRLGVSVLIDNLIYDYSVCINRQSVLEEELSVRRTRGAEQVFKRLGDVIIFGKNYENQHHYFIAQSMRENQLFLRAAAEFNAEAFAPVYNWFAHVLQVVGIDPKYESYSQMLLRDDFLTFINSRLQRYQTGIDSLGLEPVLLTSIPVPMHVIEQALDRAPVDEKAYLQIRHANPDAREIAIYIVEAEGARREAYKICGQHRCVDGELIPFDLSCESVGTQRLIELLPLFFALTAKGEDVAQAGVYVLDEIDRSLHTAVVVDLLRSFVEECSSNTRLQLIFSTHDLLLMDEDVLRKDEMWFCDRSLERGSRLTCLGNIEGVRTDTSILKSYRANAFGNYPL